MPERACEFEPRLGHMNEMKKKYVICPCYVVSKKDGDCHYIDAPTLMRLYGIDPRECIINKDHDSMRGRDTSKLIWLSARYDDNYTLPER